MAGSGRCMGCMSDHSGSGSALAQFNQQFGKSRGWGGQNRQFRGARQFGQVLEGWHVLNARMAAVDQEQFAPETARQQVAGQHRADGAGPLAGADQRHGSGLEQIPQVVSRHRRRPPPESVKDIRRGGRECNRPPWLASGNSTPLATGAVTAPRNSRTPRTE